MAERIRQGMAHGDFSSRDAAPAPAAWPLLAMLMVTYSFSWMDRFLLIVLIDPISKDLHISNTQIGLLTGFGAALLYSLAGFPIARLADKRSRSLIIGTTLGIWSTATAAIGLAQSFVSLALLRCGIAVSSAGCSPAAYSLISDSFPPTRRGTAIAIYSLGIPIGTWAGLMLGGIAADSIGWRLAFPLLALPGVVFALIILFFLREPTRGRFDDHEAEATRTYSLGEAARFLITNKALMALAFGFALLSFATTSFEAWIPTFLIRANGLSAAEVGSVSGLAQGLTGIIGALFFGIMSDRLSRRDKRWYIWIPILCGLVASPLIVLFFSLPKSAAYVCYFAIEFLVSGYSPALFAACQMLLPPRLRALGMATILFVLNVIGTGLGPSVTGWLSDVIGGAGPAGGLGPAIAAVQVAALFGLLSLVIGIRHFKRATD
jgi:predicted MFS family arabinose efflux permease